MRYPPPCPSGPGTGFGGILANKTRIDALFKCYKVMDTLLPLCRWELNGSGKRKIETTGRKCSREMPAYAMWWVK
jgi:hypothetical protein